jgi:hypothetical protein
VPTICGSREIGLTATDTRDEVARVVHVYPALDAGRKLGQAVLGLRSKALPEAAEREGRPHGHERLDAVVLKEHTPSFTLSRSRLVRV